MGVKEDGYRRLATSVIIVGHLLHATTILLLILNHFESSMKRFRKARFLPCLQVFGSRRISSFYGKGVLGSV